MAYASNVLDNDINIIHVSALHCNQSSIEGLISHVRSMKRDIINLYGVGIDQEYILSTIKREQ